MDDDRTLDSLFRDAMTAIDSGDVSSLHSLLTKHPAVACRRLESPGVWLRDTVGKALDGFFRNPYLLWFIAEDPVRNGKLPPNIAEAGRTILQKVQQAGPETLQEQIDYCLQLVSWSTVARKSGVQLELIDLLLDAGASSRGNPDNALVNNNIAAAEHLVERGAPLTLATALCLERWEDATRLAPTASPREKRFALVLSALRGKAEAVHRLIGFGVDVNASSEDLFSHGTPLHHAASSGSLKAVKELVEAGAALDARDTAFNGTPLDWAEYGRFPDIAVYLRQKTQG